MFYEDLQTRERQLRHAQSAATIGKVGFAVLVGLGITTHFALRTTVAEPVSDLEGGLSFLFWISTLALFFTWMRRRYRASRIRCPDCRKALDGPPLKTALVTRKCPMCAFTFRPQSPTEAQLIQLDHNLLTRVKLKHEVEAEDAAVPHDPLNPYATTFVPYSQSDGTRKPGCLFGWWAITFGLLVDVFRSRASIIEEATITPPEDPTGAVWLESLNAAVRAKRRLAMCFLP